MEKANKESGRKSRATSRWNSKQEGWRATALQ